MKCYLFSFFLLALCSCSQKQKLLGDTTWQKEMNITFKDASKSPLRKKDLKNFKTLDFFPFDSAYVVSAHLERKQNAKWFNMPTTSGEVSVERVYGTLSFNLNGQPFQLKVYQGRENMQLEEFKDYLFLPFLDDTNGESSYAGGRYIDLRITRVSIVEIDFNKAYNPYCAYNERYSCPIVPRENYIATEVKAGVKAFKKS